MSDRARWPRSSPLHAGVAAREDERKKLIRLYRYISRLAVAEKRLKRVFGIDIETCPACRGAVRIIACIQEPVVRLRTARLIFQKSP